MYFLSCEQNCEMHMSGSKMKISFEIHDMFKAGVGDTCHPMAEWQFSTISAGKGNSTHLRSATNTTKLVILTALASAEPFKWTHYRRQGLGMYRGGVIAKTIMPHSTMTSPGTRPGNTTVCYYVARDIWLPTLE